MNWIIPPEKWGKDHWSTLLFVESIVVDNKGKISQNDQRMRVWKHGADKNYPTRLNDGTEVEQHDDWDCVVDMLSAGLLYGPDNSPSGDSNSWALTDLGWQVAGALRRWKAEGKGIVNFRMPVTAG